MQLYFSFNQLQTFYELITEFQIWVRRVMRSCALLSLASVCSNTPKTFELFPFMQTATITVDSSVSFLFTAEMIAKMHIRGILKVRIFLQIFDYYSY